MRFAQMSLFLLCALAAAAFASQPALAETSKQVKALKGVWKVDPHKTLASIADATLKAHWAKKFKEYDTDPAAFLIAFDPEDSVCKANSSTLTKNITGIGVQNDGRTIQVACENIPMTLVMDSDTELREKITSQLYFHYRKFEDDPARFYENWRVKGRGGSNREMFLFAKYPVPAWWDGKQSAPASPAKPQSQKSDAAPAGKGGGLSKLNGIWYHDLEASIARNPERAERLRSEPLQKLVIDASARKVTVHGNQSDKVKEIAFTVSSDDGNRVATSIDAVFSLVDNETMLLEGSREVLVFSRKEPHADFIKKLNGDWTMDFAAMKKRSSDFDLTGVESCSLFVDTAGKIVTFIVQESGKSPHKSGGAFVIMSSGPQSAELNINGGDMRLEFLGDNALVMIPVDKPKNVLVFTRTK